MEPTSGKAPRTVEEYTVESLRDAILRARLKAGDHLNQTDLANWLGVSRMPIREALRQLETEGLVTFHPRRGAVVARLSASDIAEIFEMRIILEPHILRLAVPHLTQNQLQGLDRQVHEIDETADPYERLERCGRFYLNLYLPANRPRLAGLIARLRSEVGRYLLTAEVPVTGEVHGEILELCRQRKAEEAAQHLAVHLRSVGQQLYSLMAE